MAMWHIMIGLGLGVLATFLTVVANTRRSRAISQTSKPEYFSPPDDQCVICLNYMSNNEMVYLSCGHAFHEKCLITLRQHRYKKCPTCREDM